MEKRHGMGTVVFKDGNYFLEVEGKQKVIPIGPQVDTSQLKELVGQKVEILHSEPQSFVVGLTLAGQKPGIKGPRITCYIPVDPNLFGVVQEDMRASLAKQFLKEGLISQETYEKLG